MAGTMRREVADIRTRFSVVGLDAVANGFRSTARVLADATRLSRSTGAAAQGGAEAIARAVERTPSLARYPVGMASPKVRTAMRTGDLASWDLDRQCAVAASLGHRVEVVLVPPGMRAVVAFEPA
ncbi:hypothetical protein OKC48_16195 [Methylorubrum extorquens]|uniref:hypothetical protein n=1 Tax=Methylorubrum extorquens TaxID=408 RepID=UPI002238F9BF|nr:hypothetical protein [Methylorubrum extorquens]UYW24814.1 hypothetical protein OKC48_16195 [Methylorubrum extorquens]